MYVYNNTAKEMLYKHLIHRCINEGDAEAMKYLYKSIYSKNFIAMNCVKSIGINTDKNIKSLNNFDCEYLYYLGMALISPIYIRHDVRLKVSRKCFDLIKSKVPKAEARIAYINLVELPEPEQNAQVEFGYRNILQDWRERDDLFSFTVLARIKNYDCIESAKEFILSPETMTVLARPLTEGYPPAIMFYDELTAEIKKLTKNWDSYGTFDPNLDTLLDYYA